MPSASATFVRILIGGFAILVAVGYKNYRDLGAPGKRPELDNNEYWGPKLKGSYQENKLVSPYDISVAPEVGHRSKFAFFFFSFLFFLVCTKNTFAQLPCILIVSFFFFLSFTLKIIADLKAQLARPLKLQEPLEGVGFEYGFNAKELNKVVKYWRDSYLPKWNEREQLLKKFKHFQTEIQG